MTRHLPLLRDIDHILLAMPRGGEDAAREFYGRLLGMTEIEKPENLKRLGGVWFTLGDRQVHLGVEDEFRPAKKAHVAFLVHDLEALKASLRTERHAVIGDGSLPGYERFYSTDPFGNRLEFLCKL